MELIDKFKKKENTDVLHAELKAKVLKEEKDTDTKVITEDLKKHLPDSEEAVDNLDLFIEDFLTEYAKSDKTSRMVRIQEKNFDALAKLKVHNISISQFVNFAIHSTFKSKQYKKIIKTIIKNLKNKQ